jgi:hypothetical protein
MTGARRTPLLNRPGAMVAIPCGADDGAGDADALED